MRESADGLVEQNSAMVEDFLELDYSFVPTIGRVMRPTEPHNLDRSTLADFPVLISLWLGQITSV
jgi:hypothetical protein